MKGYLFVSYNYVLSEGQGFGFGNCTVETEKFFNFNFRELGEQIKKDNGWKSLVILNWRRISKHQFKVDSLTTASHKGD